MQLWVGEGQCSEAFRLSAVGERSSSVQHFAAQGADGRVATVSVEAMRFLRLVTRSTATACWRNPARRRSQCGSRYGRAVIQTKSPQKKPKGFSPTWRWTRTASRASWRQRPEPQWLLTEQRRPALMQTTKQAQAQECWHVPSKGDAGLNRSSFRVPGPTGL